MYKPIEVDALHSIRRHEVVTMLTRDLSLDFAFGSQYCRFRSKIEPWIVGSPADDRTQLTRGNGVRTQGCILYSISLVGRIE